jgi:hypothetical protein
LQHFLHFSHSQGARISKGETGLLPLRKLENKPNQPRAWVSLLYAEQIASAPDTKGDST